MRLKLPAAGALFLSAALHAALIGTLAYTAVTETEKNTSEKTIEITINNTAQENQILPPVKKRAEETKLNKQEENNKTDYSPEGATAAPQGIKEGHEGDSVMDYRDMVRRRLQENRRYPYAARSAGTEGSVGVIFSIKSGGGLGYASVESGSGSGVLDASAIEAVRGSSPFPPLPEEYTADEMEIRVNIIYRLK